MQIEVKLMGAVARFGLILLVAVSLTACGFKGPLVLPDKKPVASINKSKPDSEQKKSK